MTSPLDNTRERNLTPLLFGGLAALAVLVAGAFAVDARVEAYRIQNVERFLRANGHAGPIRVTPAKGDNCWRAAEGFHWEAGPSKGYACAGPRRKVQLIDLKT